MCRPASAGPTGLLRKERSTRGSISVSVSWQRRCAGSTKTIERCSTWADRAAMHAGGAQFLCAAAGYGSVPSRVPLSGVHFTFGEASECAIDFGHRSRGFSRLGMLYDTGRPAEASTPATEMRPMSGDSAISRWEMCSQNGCQRCLLVGPRIHAILRLETPPLAAGRKAGPPKAEIWALLR